MTTTQIQSFLKHCVVFNAEEKDGLDITSLYGRYVSWVLTGGAKPMNIVDFAIALRHHGVQHDDDQGPVRFYPGSKMIDPLVEGHHGLGVIGSSSTAAAPAQTQPASPVTCPPDPAFQTFP